MPRIRESYHQNDCVLGLWEITETSEELEAMIGLLGHEEILYRTFRNDLRKRHWLSYRVLIRQMLGSQDVFVQYAESGKPYMVEPKGHLSVSHSGCYSAVLFSRSKRVGVDVERINEKIVRVAHKFLSDEEFAYLDEANQMQQMTVIWAAKEALYKLCGRSGVDFRDHLCIEPFPVQEQGALQAKVHHPSLKEAFQVHYEKINDYMLVTVIA